MNKDIPIGGGSEETADIETLREQLRSRDEVIAKYKSAEAETQKRKALDKIVAPLNFHDPAGAIKLVGSDIRWDADIQDYIVVNPATGKPRLNSAFKPMTPAERFQEFAVENAYFVKGAVTSADGSVTVEMIFGPKSDAAKANKLAMTNYPEYDRLHKIAIQKGLIDG